MLAAVYLVIRASVVWGRTPARFPDSVGYLDFGLLSPGSRLWPVTLVYAMVRNDTARVAVQVLLGTCAWVWLARELSRGGRFPKVVRPVTLVAGLVPQVVRYDLAILSESLSITFGVAAAAASVAVTRRPSAGTRWAWTTVFVTFAMSRQQHLLLLFMAAAAVLVTVAVRRRLPAARGLVIVAAAVFGVQQLASTSSLSVLNMYTVLSERVITDDIRFGWFVERGMPDVPGMREAGGYDYVEQVPADLLARAGFPEGQAPPSLLRVGDMPLLSWVQDHGWSTYARWVVTNPADTRDRLVDLASPTLQPPNDDFLPLDTRTPVPRWLFPPWKLSLVVTLVGIVFALGASRRRDAGLLVAMLASTVVLYATAVMGSGIEHPRHVAVSAVLLAVTLLSALSTLASRRRNADDGADRADGLRD